MATLSITLPTVGQPNSTEDVDIVNAFTSIQTWANGSVGSGNIGSGQVTAAMIEAQQAWQTIAWAVGTWDIGSVSYMKDSLGFVHLRGEVFTLNAGGVITAGTTLFTLPAGYRPVNTQKMMVGIIAASVAVVLITSAGVVTSGNSISNTNTFCFANISFRAEN